MRYCQTSHLLSRSRIIVKPCEGYRINLNVRDVCCIKCRWPRSGIKPGGRNKKRIVLVGRYCDLHSCKRKLSCEWTEIFKSGAPYHKFWHVAPQLWFSLEFLQVFCGDLALPDMEVIPNFDVGKLQLANSRENIAQTL